MKNLCLGEIEVYGFVAAVEAADVAVKTANVELLGYELAGGGGMVTVKVRGQVGAVRAAITAAGEAVAKVSRVVSTQIIPRPSEQIGVMIESEDTVGIDHPEPPAPPEEATPAPKPPEPPTRPKAPEPPPAAEVKSPPPPKAPPAAEATVEEVKKPPAKAAPRKPSTRKPPTTRSEK